MSTLIIDNINHNQYYDTGDPDNNITLTNCTYVHVGEGTTGNIANTDYAEIGENNIVDIKSSSYVKIGDNNTDILITNGHYVIVGTGNRSVAVGTQQNPSTTVTRTGASSVSVARRVVGVSVTGSNMSLYKTKYSEIDGVYNEVNNSGSVVMTNSTGNRLNRCRTVELIQTNNNRLEADNMSLSRRDPFMAYTRQNQAIRAESTIERIERQADSVGTIFDTQLNILVNPKNEGKGKQTYTKIGGVWTLVEE